MIKLMETPMLALQVRRTTEDLGDVIYVHGSTFGAGRSVFYPFDGRSWADALNAANLLAALGGHIKRCETFPRATHLMHLESSRGLLYNAVNAFLRRSAT